MKRIEILNQHLFFFWTDGPQNINTLFFARWQFWKFCNWLHLVKQQAHIEELWKVEGCAAKTNFLKSSLLLMNGLCISICIKSENLSHPRHVCLLILELHASIEALLETHHETLAHCVKSPCFVQKNQSNRYYQKMDQSLK